MSTTSRSVVGAAPPPPPTKKALAQAKKLASAPALPTSKGQDPASTVVDKVINKDDHASGRPDKAAYDAEQEKFKSEIDALQLKSNEIKSKIASLSNSKSSPLSARRTELRAELDALRGDQARIKGGRGKTLDQVKAMQEQVGKKIKDLQAVKAKLNYKTVGEVDAQIANLDRQVNAGTMKLVDEKRALMEISQLKKNRKTVEGLATQQAAIDADKAKIDSIRSALDDPEAKAISDKFNAVRAELDQINKEHDELSKGRDGLYDERNAVQKELDEVWTKRKESMGAFKDANNKYYQKMNDDRAKRLERQRSEKAAYEDGKRAEINQRLLEEAQAPAFERDIEDCRTLVDFFQRRIGQTPTYGSGGTGSSSSSGSLFERKEVSGVKALELRKVEVELPTGMVIKGKKEEESYFVGGGGKKKKGPAAAKAAAAAAAAAKSGGANGAAQEGKKEESGSTVLNLPFGTLSALMTLGIPAPLTVGDVTTTIEALETKKKYFVDNQARVTREKVAAVEKKIAAAEAKSAASNGTATPAAAAAATEESTEDPAAPVVEEEEKKAEEFTVDESKTEEA